MEATYSLVDMTLLISNSSTLHAENTKLDYVTLQLKSFLWLTYPLKMKSKLNRPRQAIQELIPTSLLPSLALPILYHFLLCFPVIPNSSLTSRCFCMMLHLPRKLCSPIISNSYLFIKYSLGISFSRRSSLLPTPTPHFDKKPLLCTAGAWGASPTTAFLTP